MRRLKLVLAVLAGFLLLVVILQNTDEVTTRVLSADIVLPRAILLFLCLLFGFVLGFASAKVQQRRHEKVQRANGATQPARSPS